MYRLVLIALLITIPLVSERLLFKGTYSTQYFYCKTEKVILSQLKDGVLIGPDENIFQECQSEEYEQVD